MKAKQMAALGTLLGLTLSGALHADSGVSGGGKSQMMMFEQGSPIEDDQVMSDMQNGKFMVPAGINHAGRINPSGSYDFFGTVSFIYWMASSDGFNINQFPYTFNVTPAGTFSGQTSNVPVGVVDTGSGTEVFVKPKYKPGFKVGLGYSGGWDDWTMFLEYTRLHQRNNKLSSSSNENDGDSDADDSTTTGVFVLAGAPYNIASDQISSKWKLNLDVLDFTLGRAYYMGKRVILEPFGGLRAAWIRQDWDVSLSSSSALTPWALNPLVADEYTRTARCKSWGLGARMGVHSEWLIGCGVRLDAKASGSLLFTRYNKLRESATADTTIATQSLSYSKHYDVVRPNAEMGLGIGWGSYLGSDDGFYIDLVVTYDFNIWWNQNMLRGLSDTVNWQTGNNPTDLMYHGPTLTLRLDF